MKNHCKHLYNLVLYNVFKVMTTKPFYFNLSGKSFCQNILRLKNFKPKLRHQVVEALRMEAEAIQKLLLPHPWLRGSIGVWQGKQLFFRTKAIRLGDYSFYSDSTTGYRSFGRVRYFMNRLATLRHQCVIASNSFHALIGRMYLS